MRHAWKCCKSHTIGRHNRFVHAWTHAEQEVHVLTQDDDQPIQAKRADLIAHDTEGRRIIGDVRTAAAVAPSVREILSLEKHKQADYANVGWGDGHETFVSDPPIAGPYRAQGVHSSLKAFDPNSNQVASPGQRLLGLLCVESAQ